MEDSKIVKIRPHPHSTELTENLLNDSISSSNSQKAPLTLRATNNRTRGTKYEYRGEPLRFDPTFKGPLKGRSCTDIICLLLFVAFIAGWGGVSYYAFKNGDLNRLLVPTDSNGLKCGLDHLVIDRPYLIFFDLSKCADVSTPIVGCKTPQVCVEKCPTTEFLLDGYDGDIPTLREKLICVDGFNKEERITKVEDAIIESERKPPNCIRYYLRSDSFLKRCLYDLLPDVCPFIPESIIKKRYPRDTTSFNVVNNQNASFSYLKDSTLDKCKEKREIGQEIIKRKMVNTETYISRFVGNILVHLVEVDKAQKMAQVVVDDITNSYFEIFTGLVIAMFVCLLFIFLMRWLAGPMVWLSIIGVLALLSFSVYYSVTKYNELKDKPEETIVVSPNLESVVKSWLGQADTWFWIMIISSVMLAIIVLIIIFLRRRIIIAIALIKEGSKAVSSITSSVFFPLLPWALQIIGITFSVAILLYLASVGETQYKADGLDDNCICTGLAQTYANNQTCSPRVFAENCRNPSDRSLGCEKATCNFLGIDNPNIVTYMHVYNVIGFFWILFFISAFGEMVLASTFATWYWTFHKSDVPFFTVFTGMGRTFRYHLGTIAFGSLIVTICRIIRVILEYIDHKLKQYDNAFTRAVMCILKCFFWCLETFLKFLNKNAYIMCAIHGKNFCLSAKDAFNLLMRNVLRVVALDKVSDFLFFLSKLLISIGMAYLTYAFFSSESNPTVQYKMVPMILVFIGTYLIATVFFNVYSMAVDTLFLCFLEDCERNDGSEEKPYFMSKQLMKVLGKKNVIPRDGYGHH